MNTSEKMKVKLKGTAPIMFDRFVSIKAKDIRPEEKLYLRKVGEKNYLGMPFLNILSFLASKNSTSCCKKFCDLRKYKGYSDALYSNFRIDSDFVFFKRDDKKIEVCQFIEKDGIMQDEKSGIYVREDVARLDKGIPNEKRRPVLGADWALEFSIELFVNDVVSMSDLIDFFEKGGKYIGLGTFRPVFGTFNFEYEILI